MPSCRWLVPALALVIAACTGRPTSSSDAAVSDASVSTQDAGTTVGDAGVMVPDASATTDAALPPDAATPDAATSLDAGLSDASAALDASEADASTPTDASVWDASDGSVLPDASSPDAMVLDAGWAWDASTTDAAVALDASTPDAANTVTIRVMAANLTSGNLQSYTPGHGIRIMQGLKPDVVLIQEFNYGNNSAADIQEMVTTTFGAGFHHTREVSQIPNGVISRWPIVESGVWDDPRVSNREFVWARIDVPGTRDLWAVSVHLLTANATERNQEGTSLMQYLNSNVPAGDLLVVGGDLNTDTAVEPVFTTLDPLLEVTTLPADQDGNTGTNANRNKPYDWVMPDDDLEVLRIPVVIGAQSFPSGLVFDSRVYTPLSDVAPVRSDDSSAQSMQHMGVVKDFRIPLESAP